MDSKPLKLMRRFLTLVVLAVSLTIIATYLLSMGLGILVIFSTPEGLGFSRETVFFNPLLFIDINVSTNAGVYFVFLWWVFVFCFWAALKNRENIDSRVRETVAGSTERGLFKNNLLAMPVITSMLLVAVLALHLLQSLVGFPTGEYPQSDSLFVDFLAISRAPVVEEIVFRIVPMGAFLVTYIPLAGKKVTQTLTGSQRAKLALLSILHPDKAKNMVEMKTIDEHGLLRGTMWAEWVMVVFTALVFGVAHYTGGSGGWEVGKISQAALSGLVFAVAYLYYGVQAPILLHWFFNYYFTVFELSRGHLFDANLTGIVWLANTSFGIFLWLVAATLGVLALVTRLRLKGIRGMSRPAESPSPPPPQLA